MSERKFYKPIQKRFRMEDVFNRCVTKWLKKKKVPFNDFAIEAIKEKIYREDKKSMEQYEAFINIEHGGKSEQ